MGNGGAERPLGRPLRIGVYPLVVARGLGKQVDLCLRHGQPVAGGHRLAHQGLQLIQGLKGFHGHAW